MPCVFRGAGFRPRLIRTRSIYEPRLHLCCFGFAAAPGSCKDRQRVRTLNRNAANKPAIQGAKEKKLIS